MTHTARLLWLVFLFMVIGLPLYPACVSAVVTYMYNFVAETKQIKPYELTTRPRYGWN